MGKVKEKRATEFPFTAAPGVGNPDKAVKKTTNDNLSLEDEIVKQTVHCSTVDFFWEQGTDPVISVEGHRHEEGEDGKEITVENAQIRFSYGNYTEIEISMPKQDLKKLVIAATRFLKDGQAACFHKFTDDDTGEVEDNFKVGGFGSDLKFPTEKILKRYQL